MTSGLGGVISFHPPEHIRKDTVYLKAKFELDNGIGMAARDVHQGSGAPGC